MKVQVAFTASLPTQSEKPQFATWASGIDPQQYEVTHPETLSVRITGRSPGGIAIGHRDLLILDRSSKPRAGNVVLALVDGEWTLKRIGLREEKLLVGGIVTNVIHAAEAGHSHRAGQLTATAASFVTAMAATAQALIRELLPLHD